MFPFKDLAAIWRGAVSSGAGIISPGGRIELEYELLAPWRLWMLGGLMQITRNGLILSLALVVARGSMMLFWRKNGEQNYSSDGSGGETVDGGV